MNSKLFFRHIKHNILKYTVAFSAAVHLIGIFMFPSWGTVPDLLKHKVIKIKTVVQKPKTEPQSITPINRQKSPMVKSAKPVTPSPAKERIPVPIPQSKQNFQPVKAIQFGASTPNPVSSFQKIVEIEIPSAIPPSPRREQEETPSPHPSVQSKHLTQVAMVDLAKTPRVILSNSNGNLSGLNSKSVQISSPARFEENFSIPSPASAINIATGNRKLKTTPLILAHNIHPMYRGIADAPTSNKSFTSRVASTPTVGIKVRSPHDLNFVPLTQDQRVIPAPGRKTNQFSRKTTLMQMALIPSGFSEETINGNSETHENKPSEENNSAGGTNGNSADQMGKIKKAFSSRVWSKIAQSKYYPRLARKRGFEGEPVVAFTLRDTGDLLEVSIKNPSKYKLLDEAALAAVKSASPYPPIPEPLQMKTIRFKLPISFILEAP